SPFGGERETNRSATGSFPSPRPRGEKVAGGRMRGAFSNSRNHQLRSFKIEPEPDFLEPGLPHGVAESGLVFGVKHEKTAAARADELAAERAVGHREVIPLVDLRVAHAAAALFFALPVHVHEPREFLEFSVFERVLALQPKDFDE